MKYLLGCLVLLLLLIGGIFAYGSSLPAEMNVSVERSIAASPEQVHALVGDFRRWPDWSYWENADPEMVYTYGEKAEGVGAEVSWTGKDGDGKMVATVNDPVNGLVYDVEFGKGGDQGGGVGTVSYAPQEDGTTLVTMKMVGPLDGAIERLIGKLMSPMITEAFDYNLEHIDALAVQEKAAASEESE